MSEQTQTMIWLALALVSTFLAGVQVCGFVQWMVETPKAVRARHAWIGTDTMAGSIAASLLSFAVLAKAVLKV